MKTSANAGVFLFLNKMIYPEPLKSGDLVAVVAIASLVLREVIEPGIEVLENWGLQVQRGLHLYDRYGSFAGTDAHRLYDLQKALDDPAMRAVFIARGGYGTTRILDRIDLMAFKRDPKWVVGFSDVTAFHAHLFKHGFVGLHGPMPGYYAKSRAASSTELLRKVLFGEWPVIKAPARVYNRPGKSSGVVVGGNLAILCHMIGTVTEVETKGKILFIEDVGEHLYAIDRMMVQLKRSGKLADLAGLAVGYFSKIKDTKPSFGKSVEEIVREHVEEYNYPVGFGFPVGHENRNFPVPIGHLSELSVTERDGSTLDFQPIKQNLRSARQG